eukprot:TRINITY_DN8722_c0_g1_i1.p1 TRINITY_DN8722_c0_g1~~TRINITY_DN8722_c0_g1_i1.p1  ORF type:complete len:204 (-),score=33.18 TRINITY_DN8722_c0_g1_i1:17-628(-)
MSTHPVIIHKISQLRNKNTDARQFRELISDLSFLLIFEASKNLTLEGYPLPTPLVECTGQRVHERIGFVPILRAGLGMVDSALRVHPEAKVYHIGIYRDKRSLLPVEYYNKLPNDASVDICYILDPMVATGGTAIATINILKSWGAKKIFLIGIVVSEAAVKKVNQEHPDVEFIAGAIDAELNDHGYIIPGLGDAGDRQFQTK